MESADGETPRFIAHSAAGWRVRFCSGSTGEMPMTSVRQIKTEESFSLIFSDGSAQVKALSVQEDGRKKKVDKETAR